MDLVEKSTHISSEVAGCHKWHWSFDIAFKTTLHTYERRSKKHVWGTVGGFRCYKRSSEEEIWELNVQAVRVTGSLAGYFLIFQTFICSNHHTNLGSMPASRQFVSERLDFGNKYWLVI